VNRKRIKKTKQKKGKIIQHDEPLREGGWEKMNTRKQETWTKQIGRKIITTRYICQKVNGTKTFNGTKWRKCIAT
jgi:hypothetical protein